MVKVKIPKQSHLFRDRDHQIPILQVNHLLLKVKTNTDNYQENAKADETTYIQLKGTSAYWTTTPTSITLTTKIGAGNAYSLSEYVKVVLLDSSGDPISSTDTNITNTITTTTGDTYTDISIAPVNNVYGVRVYHVKQSGVNIRYYSFTLSYVAGSSDPTITVTPTSLTGLSYTHGNGPSTAQTFTVGGTNLTADINISSPTNYEICTSQNGIYGSSITLTQSTGTVSNTAIYARLKADQNVGTYNSENVTLTSTGATSKTVSLSGTVSGYTVTYDCNDGTNNCPDDVSDVPSGSYTINSTAPSKTNYSFGGWSDGSSTYAAGASYTITGNVTFTAQWVPDTYAYVIDITGPDTGATATLLVGGEILDENDKIDYDAEVTIIVNVSNGYSYSISVIDSDYNDVDVDDDNKFTMPASEVYITITTEVNPYLKAVLTSSNMLSMTGNVAYGNEKSVTINGYTWKTTGYQGTSNQNRMGMIQLRTSGTPYIQLPQFDGKIKEITFEVTNTDASGFVAGNNKTMTNLKFRTTSNGSDIVSGDGGSNTNYITIDLSSKMFTTGYIVSSAGIRIWKITVTYLPYSNFTDLNPAEPIPASLSAGDNVAVPSDMSATDLTIPATAALVVKSGATLTLSGTLTNQGTAANLIIEDGGQLILAKTNTGVAATVKKNVSEATAGSKTDATYWYALSADVENPLISSNTNLITESGGDPTYDLYRLNEEKNAGDAWENYRNALYGTSFTTLEKGRGYLYRNASDLTITMTGDINVEDFTYDVTKTDDGEYAGFNLIGNPYTHDIYKGAGTAITDGTSTLSTGFYYLEPSTGKWAKGTDKNTAIAPNQGILVQVDATGYINMTNTISNGSAKSNNDYIMLSVANSQYSDEAYAWFDKGIGLNKIEHRNSEIPMLYINQDGENFAIATMSDDTKSFNLNLKAMTTGKYTLSYKATGTYSYLHVIDRLTGEDVDMLLEGEYSFIASPSDAENRFIVRLEYSAGSESQESSVFAYQSGNDIIVNGEGELQIFDMMGRKVSTQYVSGVETINLQLNGVYVFRLNEKTQKIVVK